MRPKLSLPIVLAGGVLACGDAVVQPTDTTPASPSIGVVVGESWEVLGVASSSANGGAFAEGINDSGVIVGYINEDYPRPYRYSAGTITTYSATADSWMTANDVNKWGQVVGSTLVNDTVRAYVRQANGDVVLLPYSGQPGTSNYGLAINDVGEVAGMTNTHIGLRWRVAVGGWTVSSMGIVLDKPVLYVHDINNSGSIVGSAAQTLSGEGAEAFVWQGGSYQFIGTLGGARSSALSINNSGKVFGISELLGGEPRYVSWTSFGGMRNEAAGSESAGWGAISDKGRIVGYDRINGFNRAFTMYKGVCYRSCRTLGRATSATSTPAVRSWATSE